jgi:hypothetical protein
MSKAILVSADELFLWLREADVSLRETCKICLDDGYSVINTTGTIGGRGWQIIVGVKVSFDGSSCGAIREILMWGHQHCC